MMRFFDGDLEDSVGTGGFPYDSIEALLAKPKCSLLIQTKHRVYARCSGNTGVTRK